MHAAASTDQSADVLNKDMLRPTTPPQGFWRVLQFLPGPFSFAGKAAAALVSILMLLIAASDASAGMKKQSKEPRQPPEASASQPSETSTGKQHVPSPEARQLLTQVASISTFQDLALKEEKCRRHRRLKTGLFFSERSPWKSCWRNYGKISVRVSWNETSEEMAVRLYTSIPDQEEAAYRSAPLRWVNFAELHRIVCPRDSDAAKTIASLPQRLSQKSWSGSKRNEARSIEIAGSDDCHARLDERRDGDAKLLYVSLTYRIER